MSKIVLHPISFKDACIFVEKHHRHHKKPQGWKFGTSATVNNEVVGVVMVGRPVARLLDDGLTVEVIRLCTNGTPNTCSMLYGAARRAAKALGFHRIITYILESEEGKSLRAAGWECLKLCGGGTWNRKSRPRTDKHPITAKYLYQSILVNGYD